MCDPTRFLERCWNGEPLAEHEMVQLARMARAILVEEPTVVPVSTPVTVAGDIRAQFYDLLELFRVGKPVPRTNYLFLGNYVNRGYYGVQTIALLLTLKVVYPQHITLLRGNIDCEITSRIWGFYDECQVVFGTQSAVWRELTKTFNFLPLAAVIDGRVFCVHGGLSPDAPQLDLVSRLPRGYEVPHEGAYCDLLWSDPHDEAGWSGNPRGAGVSFGADIVAEFLHRNNLDYMVRSHQLMSYGYAWMTSDKQLVTIYSTPNFCYRAGNLGALMALASDGSREFQLFHEAPDDERKTPERTFTGYFL